MRLAISALLSTSLITSTMIASAQPQPPPAAPPQAQPQPAAAPPTAPATALPTASTSVLPTAPPPDAAQAPAPGAPPPQPPQPGSDSTLPTIPPPAIPSFPDGTPLSASQGTLGAGWNDGFYITDAQNNFHLYPGAVVQADVLGYFGPGVSDLPTTSGGAALPTRFILRRAQLSLSGDFLTRWSFRVLAEFGGFFTANNLDGKAEQSAAAAGATPTASTARYAPVDAPSAAAVPLDVWINYRVAPWANLQVGQFNVPFSMENRTLDPYTPFMERNVAIRGFVVPSSRDMGAMIWGDVADGFFSYEVGAFGGEGLNRPSVDSKLDFTGRFVFHPFAGGSGAFARSAQIGIDLRHGDRDPKAVGYDYSPITTGQGFALWRPTYTDSLGRLIHIIPSGAQNAIGGEIRARSHYVAVQGEAYYVSNNTREAVDGFQFTNTERLGNFSGLGWYLQVSGWPVGDTFIGPDPGKIRPRMLDLMRKGEASLKHGLELLALVSGINANYNGAARLGSADAKTPASNVTVYQFGVAAQYWHTKHARFSINYNAYFTPGSGQSPVVNQAVIPDNLLKDSAGKTREGNILHELGARLTTAF